MIQELGCYQNAEFIWSQEEPENMGGWQFVRDRIEKILEDLTVKHPKLKYIGRRPSATTATGYIKYHVKEQQYIIRKSLGLDKDE